MRKTTKTLFDKRVKRRRVAGFSLIEMVVVIAIMAVLLVVLTPSLLSHIEGSRAEKDAAAMNEVTNAVQLALSDSGAYDEMLRYSCSNNYITYTDSSGSYGTTINDEEYWAPDGYGRATTITFNPQKVGSKVKYLMDTAILNDMTYGTGFSGDYRTMEGAVLDGNQCYLKSATVNDSENTAYVYHKVKQTVGDSIELTSKTYKNSSFTVFIKWEQIGSMLVPEVYGSFNGTNLSEDSPASKGSGTIEYDEDDEPVANPNHQTGLNTTTVFNKTSLAGASTFTGDADYKADDPEYANGVTAVLYENGTLVFQAVATANPKYGEIVDGCVWDNDQWLNKTFSSGSRAPWYNNRSQILSVKFDCAVSPTNTAWWFSGLENCTTMTLTKLDTSNTADMQDMFNGCSSLTELNVSGFSTSNVENMTSMFRDCESLRYIDVSKFDTSNVKYMNQMFEGCESLVDLDLSSFNTANVTNMLFMFRNCKKLKNVDLSGFNTEKVENMRGMFWDCQSIEELNVGSFDTSNVADMALMFQGCVSLKSLNGFDFNTESATTMASMFCNCYELTQIDVSKFDTSDVTSMHGMFADCKNLATIDVSGFDTSKVINMGRMFNGCRNLQNLNVSNFNTKEVIDMNSMFGGCRRLDALDLSNFNTSNVTNMSFMFNDCCALDELDVSSFDTSKVENMKAVFWGCSGLTELNISNFNTNNVESMEYMFANCDRVQALDLSNFNTSKVTNMANMFAGLDYLSELNLSNFDTSNVTTMENIFGEPENWQNCPKLQKIAFGSGWKWIGDDWVFPHTEGYYIVDGFDGNWYNAETGEACNPGTIDGAGTYVAVKPQ